MNRLIGNNTSMALAAAVLVAGMGAAPAAAQDLAAGDRITIMVPDLAPMNDANDNFGEDVAVGSPGTELEFAL